MGQGEGKYFLTHHQLIDEFKINLAKKFLRQKKKLTILF